MELINHTSLTASSTLTRMPGASESERALLVAAKATFQWDARGDVVLERESPLPLFGTQLQSPLGLLPRDDLPQLGPQLQVMLLGKAHVPRGGFASSCSVSLKVGAVSRELQVFGDRVWKSRDIISEPVAFTSMPITYENAFGGSADVLIDADSKLRLVDSCNPAGKGLDLERRMRDFGEALRAPPGYPQLPGFVRSLPNIERPDSLIKHWDDAPAPACWTAVPTESGVRMTWILERLATNIPIGEADIRSHAYAQAHPEWIIPLPDRCPVVEMNGLSPAGTIAFLLPDLHPVIDLLVNGKLASHALAPRMLVLLPEERRFYLVYQDVLPIAYVREDDRGLRLRTDEGWGRWGEIRPSRPLHDELPSHLRLAVETV